MAIRLVDGQIQHFEDLALMNSLRGNGSGDGRGGDPADAMMRYFASATRELERAVKWYLELKEQGLLGLPSQGNRANLSGRRHPRAPADA